MEFYVDGGLRATDTTAPYTYAWETAGETMGGYQLLVKAYDAAGNTGVSPTLSVMVRDGMPPSVGITLPSEGDTVRARGIVTVDVSDNVGVARVEFYVDGEWKATDTSVPYAYRWDTTGEIVGEHALYVKAYDAAWNVGTSEVVTVRVEELPEPGMALIPARRFQMGDPFGEGYSDEVPVHTVYVDSFYMDVFEVTNALYRAYDPSHDSGRDLNEDDQPVVYVSWWAAIQYCNGRSRQEGLEACYNESTGECDFTKNGYRLPTEAEWEYAARGGLEGKRYPWGDEEPVCEGETPLSYASVRCHDIIPGPVGIYFPNGNGLYDIAGNVREWCHDWYEVGYYSNSPEANPTGPESGSQRVVRGGSSRRDPYNMRCADRYAMSPEDTNYLVGFRCVRRP